jgi:ABC-type antimicrobial peptide transport system permease subunit
VALLAVAVAAAGAYALAADTLRRSRTELVLSRLHGASSAAIVQRVALAFATPLALALLVGLPLAAALGMRYRAEFVDRAPAAWGLSLPLLLAAVFTVLVLALAAWRHTRIALAIQPIEALR